MTDRVWFKVKVGRWRGAALDSSDESGFSELAAEYGERWWICAAGIRSEDSPQTDFYSQLDAECHTSGASSCSTDRLLPREWDKKRLIAEASHFAVAVLATLVRDAASDSLLNGEVTGFRFGERDIRVRVRVHDDGQAYVAIGATGITDVTLYTVLFSSIPEVKPSDWLPEPDGGLGIEPASGEVLWSTILPHSAQVFLANRSWAQR